jgi:glutamate-1-semialdehyde aminotransferase
MSKGTDLWLKAKTLIPGGNQLLSKRSEMFLPGLWPSYYQKAKGCEIWDLDGKHYYDFAQMGVGSCILGYADEDVDRAVIQAIENGSMSTLNSWEEVELAKRLLELHPWGEMVRFSRTGGEACAIAIRIARAATGKDKVAFCGYHGWHDWYISSNLGDQSNLDGQLLPGLEPRGVPRALKNTALPFNYNRLDELERILDENRNEIGAIIMEPVRGTDPAKGFLEGVRELSNKHKAALIFDEVTSGFRMNLGGIHLNYGVEPDIAVFGKALGNGFPISAIVGKRKYMDAAQESFISSTFWTERIGFVAALATLDKMKKCKVQEKLAASGEKINQGWLGLSMKYNIPIEISGIKPLTHISFKVKDPLAAQTLYTQEMLEQGFLLGASVYATYAYSDKVIDQFIERSSQVFARIKQAIDADDFKKYLKGPVKHAGFKRLT